jgi:hypothetical protein
MYSEGAEAQILSMSEVGSFLTHIPSIYHIVGFMSQWEGRVDVPFLLLKMFLFADCRCNVLGGAALPSLHIPLSLKLTFITLGDHRLPLSLYF